MGHVFFIYYIFCMVFCPMDPIQSLQEIAKSLSFVNGNLVVFNPYISEIWTRQAY